MIKILYIFPDTAVCVYKRPKGNAVKCYKVYI